MDLTSLKGYLSTAVKILPKPLRYSIRSYARLHEDILHPELKLIDFHTGSPIIFDVGANIGGFVGDLMLRAPLARFHCFEPHPEIFEALKRNCVKYGMLDNKPRAIANNFALGSREETKEFILTDRSVCSSFFEPTDKHRSWAGQWCETKDKAIVQVKTLRDYALANKIENAKLLKIDAQGYELEVLKGAGDFLPQIEYVYSEVQFSNLYDGAPIWTDVIKFMHQQGFSPNIISGICLDPNADFLQADILFKNTRS
jgi:FkbM family methyltransferase